MAGNYSHTTRGTGTTLTATIYNEDHAKHVTFNTPAGLDDYSTNESQMQTTTDPYPGQAVSLATSTAGEFERIRHLIKQITGQAQWYIDPDTNLASVGAGDNLLINGGFNVSQRGTSFDSTTIFANNDDTYLLDRWLLLSDGNDIVDVTQQSSGGISGTEDYIRLDVETISKKFGILQIVENKNLKNVIGGSDVVSLSFEAKTTDITKLSDIRAVVLAWDSTADTVTSDIISAWESEGVRPTLVANWTEENTDSDLGITASWARYTIENISIDTASTTNIGVFIYQNNVATSDTAGIFLEITNVQLVQSPTASTFQYLDIDVIVAKCQRYFEKTYNLDVAPGTVTSAGEIDWGHTSVSTNNIKSGTHCVFNTSKRVTPTMVFFSSNTGTSGKVYSVGAAGDVNPGDIIKGQNNTSFTAFTGVTTTNQRFNCHYTAESEL